MVACITSQEATDQAAHLNRGATVNKESKSQQLHQALCHLDLGNQQLVDNVHGLVASSIPDEYLSTS
jgi:hypothetical protein